MILVILEISKAKMSIKFDNENKIIRIKTDQGNTINITSQSNLKTKYPKTYKVKKKCANCNIMRNKELKKCGGCRKIYYCGNECQRNNWKYHKNKCSREFN